MDALRKMNFFKNPINGWRSYPESLPISIFTSLILSSSLEYGDRYFKQKNEL